MDSGWMGSSPGPARWSCWYLLNSRQILFHPGQSLIENLQESPGYFSAVNMWSRRWRTFWVPHVVVVSADGRRLLHQVNISLVGAHLRQGPGNEGLLEHLGGSTQR